MSRFLPILLALATAGAACAAERVTLVSSLPVQPPSPNGGMACTPDASADGRFVALCSYATNLVAGVRDDNGAPDVFVHDRATGTTVLASHALGDALLAARGGTMTEENGAVRISADGSTVIFLHDGNDLTAQGGNGTTQLYRYDVASGAVSMVSRAATGSAPGNAQVPDYTGTLALSADGKRIVFVSEASNLVAGQLDTSASADVFLHDADTGNTTLLTHAGDDPLRARGGGSVDITPDGRYLVYSKPAASADPGVVRHDLLLGERRQVSHAAGVPSASRPGHLSAITDDGAKVAFLSASTDLVAGQIDPASRHDLFLWDAASDTTLLVSHRAGEPLRAANGAVEEYLGREFWMSADASVLLYSTRATDAVAAADTNQAGLDVIRYDGTAQRLDVPGGQGSELTAVSASGQIALTRGPGGEFLHDLASITAQPLAAALEPGAALPAVPDECRYSWGFVGEDPLLHCSVTLHGTDITLSALRGLDGTTRAFPPPRAGVTPYQAFGGSEARSGSATNARGISADGQRIAFHMAGGVYVRDRGAAPRRVLPQPALGFAASGRAVYITLSPDGSTLGFSWIDGASTNAWLLDLETGAAQAVTAMAGDCRCRIVGFDLRASLVLLDSPAAALAGGLNPHEHWQLYLHRRATGQTTLVSRRPPAAGGQASTSIYEPAPLMSRDGAIVAFGSSDGTLAGNATPAGDQFDGKVYLYETVTGTLRLVSHALASTQQPLSPGAWLRGLSHDGRYLTFLSDAPQVVAGVNDANGSTDVFLYDRITGARRLLSHRHDAAATTLAMRSEGGLLSGDGRWATIEGVHDDFVAGFAAGGKRQVYLVDLASGERRVVSRAPGAGPAANADASALRLGSDGEYVFLMSRATNLMPQPIAAPANALYYRYRRSDGQVALVTHREDQPALPVTASVLSHYDLSDNGRAAVFGWRGGGLSSLDGNRLEFDVYRADVVADGYIFADGMEGQ